MSLAFLTYRRGRRRGPRRQARRLPADPSRRRPRRRLRLLHQPDHAHRIRHRQQGPLNSATQAAQVLRPVAGHNAELLFALGLIGASALAAAIVPLSASYAIGEAAGAERSVSRSFRDAPLFLGLFTDQIVLGATVALTPVDVIQLLIGTQILQGPVSPIVLADPDQPPFPAQRSRQRPALPGRRHHHGHRGRRHVHHPARADRPRLVRPRLRQPADGLTSTAAVTPVRACTSEVTVSAPLSFGPR
ncbi:divalent metal cation transporter [Streptomyces sp. WAC 06725]|uniref:divalent metal cation transporter n=1 Tax=Streptomyces sp. WAC 06725 TaxID=2203209 RepID=UPI000F74A80E